LVGSRRADPLRVDALVTDFENITLENELGVPAR
jgi:hypothetical protein